MKKIRFLLAILFAGFLAVSLTTCGISSGGGGGGATSSPGQSISGTIMVSDSGLSGVTVTLSGAASATTTTASDGTYQFTGLQNGSYTVTPSMTGKIFNPSNRMVTITGANIPGQDFTARNQGVTYIPGNTLTVATQTITQTGGTIEAGSSGTPIDGVQVQFPAGALSADTNVSLGYNTGTLSPNEGTYPGVALTLDTGNIAQFEQPVTIKVPFADINTTPVPYYVDSDGKLHPLQLIKIDRTAKTFTFQTSHASLFTWIFSLFSSTAYAPGPNDIVNTGFSPDTDAFQIVNQGNDYNREGECFGMTSFALWYFLEKKATKGIFYPKYMNKIEDYPWWQFWMQDIVGQDIIATRAFISITRAWNTYYKNIIYDEANLSAKDRYAYILNVISTRGPVLIYLWHETGNDTGAHSVLAYAFNRLNGTISIYDPNYPGQSKIITYNESTKSFNSYSGYDGVAYCGDGYLSLSEPYEPYQNILDDADANFQGTKNAVITLTSHTYGQTVAERSITLEGKIESGEILVDKLLVYVGSTPFEKNVEPSGEFSLTIALESGVNYLTFVPYGTTLSTQDHRPVEMSTPLPSSLDNGRFKINLNIPKSIILVTVTWDSNDTDVDLYVIDPTGDYSCYYHLTTADGGELDHDITTGYGPEHWTLMNTDMIRYNQAYRVRLHYYSDHGNGPTNYTVSIKIYEGTTREQEYWYRGNLAASNPRNDAPDNTGPDWVDIADIILTQTPSSALETNFKGSILSDREIKIAVPVPMKGQRIKQGFHK